MTITIMTNATMTCNAIKPSVNNMSNIRKSVANIQHTRHIRSAIAAILITYDKHPPLIIDNYLRSRTRFAHWRNCTPRLELTL